MGNRTKFPITEREQFRNGLIIIAVEANLNVC